MKKLGSLGVRGLLFAIIFIIGVVIVFFIQKKNDGLPIYQPSDINPRLVDEAVKTKENHTLLDFNLVNHLGEPVSLNTYQNKIILADFFFTTCPSICPKMSGNMEIIANEFKDEPSLMLLSHTVDPETDSVAVLKNYADLYNINPNQWQLLTGDKAEIYKLARQSYFAAIDEPSDEGPDFVHTENFVLVDKQHRLRGFYDGTNPKDINRVIADIKTLLEENE